MFKFQDFGQTDLLKKLESYENSNQKFTANVGKYKITYGAGGAHYGKKGIWKGQILNIDFASLYPHIMVNYKLYSRKIKNPESRYAEFSHVISKACQHISVKVLDEQDVQTFLTLATTLNNAVNAGTVIDKKKKFTNLETVIAKIKEAATTYFGHEF